MSKLAFGCSSIRIGVVHHTNQHFAFRHFAEAIHRLLVQQIHRRIIFIQYERVFTDRNGVEHCDATTHTVVADNDHVFSDGLFGIEFDEFHCVSLSEIDYFPECGIESPAGDFDPNNGNLGIGHRIAFQIGEDHRSRWLLVNDEVVHFF